MKVLVVLAHPRPGSFNHAIAETSLRALKDCGHRPLFHDLYAEGFDPLMTAGELTGDGSVDDDVRRCCSELTEAGGMVFIHPNWWGQPPAMLKGWIDRVFRPGVAYRFLEGDGGEGVPVGLLKGKRAVIFNTSDTPAEREASYFGDPLENTWGKCILGFCGVEQYTRTTFGVVVTSTPEMRSHWLSAAEAIIRRDFPAV